MTSPSKSEAELLEESLKTAAYVDYHIKRGTGTWRDWEHSTQYDMRGYSDAKSKGDNDGTKSNG